MNRVLCAYPLRKLLLLTAALYLLNLLTGWLFEPGLSVPGASALALFAGQAGEALIQSVVILELVRRSVWRGGPLALGVSLVHFGVVSALTWIESLFFLSLFVHKMTPLQVHLGLARGLVTAAALGALAASLAGPARNAVSENPAAAGLPGHKVFGWVFRLTGVALLYVVIFFLFGLFVAVPLAGEEFHKFYGDLQPGAWILFLEAGRGLGWGLVAVLIVRMVDLERNKAALMVGLVFSLLLGALLVSPNPILQSDRLRWSHFVEIVSENFIFGYLAVRILSRKVKSLTSAPAA
ncbi:hypothetical protein LLH00_09340 [bacterium]|nr:hypothetical protein [bacterium]